MQIKSWQIASTGIFASIFFLNDIPFLYLILYPNFIIFNLALLWLAILFVPIMLYVDTIKNPGTIVSLFNGTSKAGAIISVISGLIIISGNFKSFVFGDSTEYFSLNGFKIIGVFFIFAGVYYFWKENKVKA